MAHAESKQFKRMLQDMLAASRSPLRRREDIAVENAADTLDQVWNAADRELAARQLDLDSSRLSEVRAALQRIEDGAYGICEECESEIGVRRLRAVPWARYCISCQELADHNQGQAKSEPNPFAPVPRKPRPVHAD